MQIPPSLLGKGARGLGTGELLNLIRSLSQGGLKKSVNFVI